MMKRIFSLLLRLYPRDYRVEFGSEMTSTFEQAASDRRRRGRTALLRFLIVETAGALAGAVRERFARPAQRGVPLDEVFPDEILEARRRVDATLRQMMDAIASHRFERARSLSNEERRERENLRRLYEKYDIDDASGFTIST